LHARCEGGRGLPSSIRHHAQKCCQSLSHERRAWGFSLSQSSVKEVFNKLERSWSCSPFIFLAIQTSERWGEGLLHDCLFPGLRTDIPSSQYRKNLVLPLSTVDNSSFSPNRLTVVAHLSRIARSLLERWRKRRKHASCMTTDFENESVMRTKRARRWRSVVFQHST
jgi:hypothetical protein